MCFICCWVIVKWFRERFLEILDFGLCSGGGLFGYLGVDDRVDYWEFGCIGFWE